MSITRPSSWSRPMSMRFSPASIWLLRLSTSSGTSLLPRIGYSASSGGIFG